MFTSGSAVGGIQNPPGSFIYRQISSEMRTLLPEKNIQLHRLFDSSRLQLQLELTIDEIPHVIFLHALNRAII